MHKVRIVQKLSLPHIERRLEALDEAGNNTFLLKNSDIYLDMLTDSGVNAMSDKQLAAMMECRRQLCGSATFTKLENKIRDIFGTEYFLPVHQGRAAENMLAKVFVRPGQVVPMNYHFTTTKAHICVNGGAVDEIIIDEGLEVTSTQSVQGQHGHRQAGGGHRQARGGKHRLRPHRNRHQPDRAGSRIRWKTCGRSATSATGTASCWCSTPACSPDNLYFIKTREEACKQMSVREITREIADLCDIIYFSARKLGCARGGGICTNSRDAS